MIPVKKKDRIHIRQFTFDARSPWHLEKILLAPKWQKFWRSMADALHFFPGRIIWNINSTAAGGGVAEILRSLLPYFRGAGVDARWMVILANAPFFQVTKRIHNFLHGSSGDGGELGKAEKKIYEQLLRLSSQEFFPLVRPKDLVILHDPQTAGMIPFLKKKGLIVIWRCHIGTDSPNDYVKKGWSFLKDYIRQADAVVFSRNNYVPDFINPKKVEIIFPSIDPFSPKNQDMDLPHARAILDRVGIIKLHRKNSYRNPTFFRSDGSSARIDRPCEVFGAGKIPSESDPLIVQISRWDRLKDPIGVMEGFTGSCAQLRDAHLLLVGPVTEGVADDPEGQEVLAECKKFWKKLPRKIKLRVHLVCLPMRDLEENAAIVNALQRQATVLVQKSLQEGFGLTVTEAMWKGRPVVASAVGGIQEQISHEKTGLLLKDPKDTKKFGSLLIRLFQDRSFAEFIGRTGKISVWDHFIFNRHLEQYLRLFIKLIK